MCLYDSMTTCTGGGEDDEQVNDHLMFCCSSGEKEGLMNAGRRKREVLWRSL